MKFLTYLKERFPVPVTLALAFATAAASEATAGAAWTWETARATALAFLLLFHLRVFDEHKDAAVDAATRPDRPVQRGLVTLRQLAVAGAITIALEIVIGGSWWMLPLGYSVLMLFEFGAPRWLERHYAIYAISHSAIMSVVCLAMVERAGGAPLAPLLALGGLALASTFSIDVLRKIYPTEVAGVDSWSKLIGARSAGVLAATLLVIAAACASYLAPWWWPALITVPCVLGIFRFLRRPALLQTIAGVHYLAIWIAIGVLR